MQEPTSKEQIRLVMWQFLGVLCAASAALLFYSSVRGGDSTLGLIGCVDAAGAVLFFRRVRSAKQKAPEQAD